MSIIGEYLRVTTDELERVIQDPDWALDFVEEVRDAEEEKPPAPSEARHFSTYKAWDMLRFLMARADFPVDVIHGEEGFTDSADWGYGPPRYLRPERVRDAAQALRRTSYAQLLGDLAPAELSDAEVYPLGWDEAGALDWARPWYDGLRQFFHSAAEAGDAMLVWLD
ncbi:YfbM family protein [Streptomyces sp. NPDC006422]|uniref:YfbM family protein n=1 Tax=unclassified Streptomyces TaxID=2593676 RepID=UPI0033BF73F4